MGSLCRHIFCIVTEIFHASTLLCTHLDYELKIEKSRFLISVILVFKKLNIFAENDDEKSLPTCVN